jgi:hypothetical protein
MDDAASLEGSGSRVVASVLVVFFVGILAVIGGARLRRSLQASAEAQALGDIRSVISAEQAYASTNFGLFDDVVRLCRKGFECAGAFEGPDFLSPEIARRSPYHKGYFDRAWVDRGRPETLPEGASPTSVLDYCYISRSSGWLWERERYYVGFGPGEIAPNESTLFSPPGGDITRSYRSLTECPELIHLCVG